MHLLVILHLEPAAALEIVGSEWGWLLYFDLSCSRRLRIREALKARITDSLDNVCHTASRWVRGEEGSAIICLVLPCNAPSSACRGFSRVATNPAVGLLSCHLARIVRLAV